MTLLADFQAMLARRRDQLETLTRRVDESTAEIERLMAQNEEDTAARADLLSDVDYLEREIARLQEHEPVPASAIAPRPVPADKTPTQQELDEMIAARHEAEREAARATGRRQKPKPDKVKAARKAQRAAEAAAKAAGAAQEAAEEAASAAAGARGGGPRYAKDPLRVNGRPGVPHEIPPGRKNKRLMDYRPDEIDVDSMSPTTLERADLVFEALAERDGCAFQADLADDVQALMDCERGTAQSIVSKALFALVGQRRALYAGSEKRHPGDRNPAARWKTFEAATPQERCSAGLGCDEDDFAGQTTRWPNEASTPRGDGLVRIESGGAFESGKGR